MYGLEHDESHFKSFDFIKSLPVLLSGKGYLTARVGKFHVAPEEVYHFDQVLSAGKANDNSSVGRNPVAMAELCKPVINQKAQPFFLYYATDDPHRSTPHNSWPQPNPFGNHLGARPGTKDIHYAPEEVIVPDFLPDIPMVRQELAQYYQSVSRLDQGVGRLIQMLKEAGVYDNTLIVYLSDNGIAFQGAKTTVYDPGLRLPLIVKQPKSLKAGTVADAMVSWTDLAPTVLDYAGAPDLAKHMHGQSFRDILQGASPVKRDTVFASHTFHEIEMYYPMRAIRTRHYKLIWNIAHPLDFPLTLDLINSSSWQAFRKSGDTLYGKRTLAQFLKRPPFELYDLAKDPHEVVNLTDDPAYRDIRETLIRRLKLFQQETGDPWVRKWEFE